MKILFAAALAALPAIATAAPLELTPASPQPTNVTSGLSVTYAYPSDVKTLADAREAIEARASKGPALPGLSFDATNEGDKVMTSKFSTMVVADIQGYVRFDAAGLYTVNVWVNDGIEATLGGQEIAYVDERLPCQSAGEVEVNVPEAGWYAIEALYFQRNATACLMMEWGQNGNLDLVPDAAFGH